MFTAIIFVFVALALREGKPLIHKNEIEAAVEFFEIQNMPLKITAFICWEKADVIYLIKCLNKNSIFVSINYDFDFQNKSLPTYYPGEHQFYFIDANCDYSTNILITANETNLFKFPYRWLILNKPKQDFNFKLNSRIYIFNSNDNRINSIYELNGAQKSNDVAFWNGTKFDYHNRISDVKNRSDLMGMHMNISIVYIHDDTLNHLEDLRDRHIDAITKHNYYLVRHIAELLNITQHYTLQRTWGAPNKTTMVYSGLIGELQTGIAEIGGTPSFFTLDRIPIVDYVGATTTTEAMFIFKAPPLSVVANVFTLPFDILTWYACYVIMVIIFFVVYLIIKWEWKEVQFERTIDDKHGVLKPTILDVIQMEIGAICQQGAEAEPKSISGRIATFMIFLSLLFLYTSYCANIVALLQSTTESINSLDALLHSKIKLGAIDIAYSRYYFQRQTGIQRDIYLTKVAPPNKPDNFMTPEEGVEKIRTDFFAFFGECNTIYNIISDRFMESEKCGLMQIKYWSITHPYVPIRKNSTYKELIKIGYAMLYERGVQSRNFRRLYIKKPLCQNQGANFVSVSINDCYFAGLLFGAGIGVSIILFLIEYVLHKYANKNKIIAINVK